MDQVNPATRGAVDYQKQMDTLTLMEVVMLVLSRKLNEKIVIDGEIVVTVVKIDRNQVRLGIEAPGHIPVYREEILPLGHAARPTTTTDEALLALQA